MSLHLCHLAVKNIPIGWGDLLDFQLSNLLKKEIYYTVILIKDFQKSFNNFPVIFLFLSPLYFISSERWSKTSSKELSRGLGPEGQPLLVDTSEESWKITPPSVPVNPIIVKPSQADILQEEADKNRAAIHRLLRR